MKTISHFKRLLMAFMALLLFACSTSRPSNYGTASDRTGTNGATNGTGKAPSGTAHNLKY